MSTNVGTHEYTARGAGGAERHRWAWLLFDQDKVDLEVGEINFA